MAPAQEKACTIQECEPHPLYDSEEKPPQGVAQNDGDRLIEDMELYKGLGRGAKVLGPS